MTRLDSLCEYDISLLLFMQSSGQEMGRTGRSTVNLSPWLILGEWNLWAERTSSRGEGVVLIKGDNDSYYNSRRGSNKYIHYMPYWVRVGQRYIGCYMGDRELGLLGDVLPNEVLIWQSCLMCPSMSFYCCGSFILLTIVPIVSLHVLHVWTSSGFCTLAWWF